MKKSDLPFAKSAEAVASMLLDADPASDPALEASIGSLGRFLESYKPAAYPVAALALALDYAAALTGGGPLRKRDIEGRRRFLKTLERMPLGGLPLTLASLPFKLSYLVQDETLRRTGARYGITPPAPEKARWTSQMQRAAEADADIEIEAEAVVIGTGAGGAAAAHELASRGVAVAMVEAGDYFDRSRFNGRHYEVFNDIYRFYTAVGTGLLTITAGESVGGTTTINSGTCFRTPEPILRRWREEGLLEFTASELAPYFDSVERMLGVAPAAEKYAGPLYEVVRRGARQLGLNDVHLLPRNAPDCDGQGLCAFGCPTDAKRSTNVSYVPAALDSGAVLYAGFKVDRLVRNGNRVTGVAATGRRADGTPVRLRITAPTVIVAMGTIQTPVFLMKQGIRNRHLGDHLTVHPAGLVTAIFDDIDFGNEHVIPQAVGIGDLAAEGIRFEGGTPPLSLYGALLGLNGRRYREEIDAFANTAFLGFMVADAPSGRVRAGIGDHPLVTYRMSEPDLEKFVKGLATVARVFSRAGARKINVASALRKVSIKSEADIYEFAARKWRARDFNMTAYHPLGTARIGTSPETGVCDPDHRVYGVEGLYVMDGSNVPSSLGVNPQITIMTLATRAAAKLADRTLRLVAV